MTRPEPWFERMERDQAATGYVQCTPGSSWFPETTPRSRERTLRVTPIADRPVTPNIRGLMTELASYAWGLATNKLRGGSNGS